MEMLMGMLLGSVGGFMALVMCMVGMVCYYMCVCKMDMPKYTAMVSGLMSKKGIVAVIGMSGLSFLVTPILGCVYLGVGFGCAMMVDKL